MEKIWEVGKKQVSKREVLQQKGKKIERKSQKVKKEKVKGLRVSEEEIGYESRKKERKSEAVEGRQGIRMRD